MAEAQLTSVLDQLDQLEEVVLEGSRIPFSGGRLVNEQDAIEVMDALRGALDSVAATQGKAEALTSAYERGEVTDVAKVMLARQESGIAFEATLQVRNRLLSAYQDIMRMGV